MANTLKAGWGGNNYQARVFWENALNLLYDHSCVVEVTFEANSPKSFDDIVVRYNPPVPRSNAKRISTEYHQVKWHVDTGGKFGHEDLICPKFINAKSTSLLQRLKNAREKLSDPETAQFTFLTTQKVKDGDPLARLISSVDRTLILERLFDGKGDRSRMGKLRRLWRVHLNLKSDYELKSLLDGFRIIEDPRSLDEIRNQISSRAETMGIKGINASNSDFRLDELARQLKTRKQNTLTRKTLLQVFRDEELLVGRVAKLEATLPVAIRSFLGPAADVSDAMPENTLLLTDQFKQRYLQDNRDWQQDIRPQVENFLRDTVHKSSQLRLILDAHTSIAFLSGTVLNTKSAVEVQLVQKGRTGAKVWRADDGTKDNAPQLSRTSYRLGSGKNAVVSISIAQPVETKVREYVAEHLPSPGQLLTFAFPDGPGHQIVTGGGHAAKLAEQISNVIRQTKHDDIDTMVHIFAAAPNALMFYLGQHHQSIAPCTVYEFDFDRQGNRTYQPSFVID